MRSNCWRSAFKKTPGHRHNGMAKTTTALGPLSKLLDGDTGQLLGIIDAEGRPFTPLPVLDFTAAQLSAMAAAGGLTPFATYIPSDASPPYQLWARSASELVTVGSGAAVSSEYHAHFFAPLAIDSDTTARDISGALSDGTFQADLSAATAWATAGFLTQPNPTVAGQQSMVASRPSHGTGRPEIRCSCSGAVAALPREQKRRGQGTRADRRQIAASSSLARPMANSSATCTRTLQRFRCSVRRARTLCSRPA